MNLKKFFVELWISVKLIIESARRIIEVLVYINTIVSFCGNTGDYNIFN